MPDRNLIIVSPAQETSGFEVGKVVSGGELTEWNNGHPILTYIDTATIRLSRFLPMVPPLWGQSIISTSKGSVLFAGERGTRRAVVVGFDLFPYLGRISPTISVLFLNMLRWVSTDPFGGKILAPYEPIVLSKEVTQVIALQDQMQVQKFSSGEQQALVVPSAPGIYLGLDGDVTLSANPVNFASAHESNLLLRHEPLALSAVSASAEKLEKKQSLNSLLIPFLLALILIDMLYLLYRVSSRRFKTSSPRVRGRAVV